MKKEYDLRGLKKRAKKTSASREAATVQISVRLDGSDLAMLREEAIRVGLPYQTLLKSVVHQYVNGDLVPKKTVAMLKKLQSV